MYNGIILAGGLSSRFGSCKSQLEMDKHSLLQRNYELLAKYCDKVAVSCKKDAPISGYDCIFDMYSGNAPVIGIYSALEYFKSPVIVLSCDLPFINNIFIEQLINARNTALKEQKEIEMTTFFHPESGFIEALIAIYEYTAKEKLKKAIEDKTYTLYKAISADFRQHVPTEEKDAFFNINYPADLIQAEKMKYKQ